MQGNTGTESVPQDEGILDPLIAQEPQDGTQATNLFVPPRMGKGEPPVQLSEEENFPILHEYHAVQDDDAQTLFKGEVQPLAYRDVPFAILFCFQVLAMFGMAVDYGWTSWIKELAMEDEKNGNEKIHPMNIITLFSFIFGAAALITMLTLRFVLDHPTQTVKGAFFAAPLVAFLLSLFIRVQDDDDDDDSSPHPFFTLFWIIAVLSFCWYKLYKRCIPFASSTLQTACRAIQGQQLGLLKLQAGLSVFLCAYTFVWILAVGGVWYHDHSKGQVPCSTIYDDDDIYDQGEMCDAYPMSWLAIFFFFLCLFWTQQVVRNLLHATTSGVVGIWWCSPPTVGSNPSASGQENTHGQLSPVERCFRHSTTYSFGSICFGSLLVSFFETLEYLWKLGRGRSGERSLLGLVVECFFVCVRSFLEYFNSWAFCYVGIYGYDFPSAGRNVMRLFQERGWTTFVADRLVFRTLVLVNIVVAAMTGVSCFLLAYVCMAVANKSVDHEMAQAVLWIGFALGLYVSGAILYVVESAARAVIVLFAESASALSESHLDDYEALKEGWSQSYPDEWQSSAPAVAPAASAV